MFLVRAKNWLQFRLELFVLRGPFYRLLVVVALIGMIATCAGSIMFASGSSFQDLGEAIWWAFLRLSDPGYLGDDEGVLRRVVSTIITVLGYVVFLGALVAIMTQWFHQTMRRLQEGLTPIVQRQHILVLGWTNRTAVIVRELFHSEGRVPNYLARIGAKRLSVVLLTEADTDLVVRHLANVVGKFWQPARFVLRWGSTAGLNAQHLARVDFLHASTIILPADEAPSTVDTTVDGTTIKNLITIADVARDAGCSPPPVVAEILDIRRASLARRAYRGGQLLVVASDDLISRLLVQNIWHPGLSVVYGELLGHDHGSEFYVRHCPNLAGKRLTELAPWFPSAIPIGVVREHPTQPAVLCAADYRVEPDDKLVLLAEDFDAAAPGTSHLTLPRTPLEPPNYAGKRHRPRRLLLLGWNHKVPAILNELRHQGSEVDVDILSRVQVDERHRLLERWGFQARGIHVRHHVGDFTSAADLERVKLADYETAVVLASDWSEVDAETDSRAILGYFVLLERCEGLSRMPNIIVELLNPENRRLFEHRPGELLVSPLLASHVLTQVALRHELLPVFEELFTHDGAEIDFVEASECCGATPIRFDQARAACTSAGLVAIGVRGQDGVELNPKPEAPVCPGDELVVLSPALRSPPSRPA